MIRVIAPLFLLLFAVSASATQQESSVAFGRSLQLLTYPDGLHFFNFATLTPDDGILAHVVTLRDRSQIGPIGLLDAQTSIWTLDETSSSITAIEASLGQSVSFTDSPTYSAPALAFSPDGTYLAVYSGQVLRVYSFPNFELVTELNLDTLLEDSLGENQDRSQAYQLLNAPQWSPDQQYVAIATTAKLISWNWQEGTTVLHSLQADIYVMEQQYVVAIPQGWFINYASYANIFEVCSVDLAMCSSYEGGFERVTSIVAPNGQFVLTQGLQAGLTAAQQPNPVLWAANADGIFMMGASVVDMGTPRRISPYSPHAIASRTGGGGSDIWNIETLEIVLRLPHLPSRIAWLPDGEHIVTVDIANLLFELYRFDLPQTPIARLDLRSQSGFEDSQNWIEPETFKIVAVSADGRRVLVNLGWALVVVEVEYA